MSHILLDAMAAIDNERKEFCIHCGKEWYSIYYRDGLCHACQMAGKKGRSQLESEAKTVLMLKSALWALGIIAINILVAIIILSMLTKIS